MDLIHEILHALLHPISEALSMAPILFLAYLFMEWLEHNSSTKFLGAVNRSRKAGPLIGSVLGLIPQCGFSGAIAGMYAAGTVTTGTLLAVILATSDEMLPMMIGAKLQAGLIISILILKFAVGVVCGFILDVALKKRHAENEKHIHDFCEQENCSCKDGVWLSALKHTAKILLIIYIVSAMLHFIVGLVPNDVLATILNFPVISQFVASLIGLIPNCAVSVTLTQLYIDGALGISPLMCGLLTNGGVGLLVLYRVNRNKKDNLKITLAVFLSGLVFGSLAGFIL